MGRLFWKIFLFTLLAQALATIAIGGVLWLHERSQNHSVQDLDTSPPAAMMIDAAAATLEFGGVGALRQFLQRPDGHHVVFAVDDGGRESLDRPVVATTLAHARRLQMQEPQSRVVRHVTGIDGSQYVLFLPNLGRAPPEHGPDARSVPFSPPMDRQPPREGHFFPWLGLVMGLLVSLIFASLVAWYFSKPIRQLRYALAAAASGKLDFRVQPQMGKRHDELADLGRDFDRMSGQLQSLIDGQRHLLHDVSHELRSPLARLQAALGLARQRPENVESSLVRIERECERMEKLVGALLTISRLDAREMHHPSEGSGEVVELPDLLHAIVDDAQCEAQTHGSTVLLNSGLAVQIRGYPDLLYSAIENVLQNALKHTPSGGTISLDLHADGLSGMAILTINDQGPGVPETELNSIFAPFFRGAEARSNTNGHGLGLAIAKRVLATHGGTITATNLASGGLSVTMVFPMLGATGN